jgi:hypothetical protein
MADFDNVSLSTHAFGRDIRPASIKNNLKKLKRQQNHHKMVIDEFGSPSHEPPLVTVDICMGSPRPDVNLSLSLLQMRLTNHSPGRGICRKELYLRLDHPAAA